MNPIKFKMANEWMQQESATPQEALNTWNEMEAEFKANRAVVQEPGSMVGTPTEEVTQFDRRIYETPEGERVSEKSTTFFLNGQWMNVPTIHNGRSFTDDQLRFMIKQGQIQPTSVHGSRNEAEEAAGQRSNMMKSHTRGFDEGGQVIGKPGGLVESGVEYYAQKKKIDYGLKKIKGPISGYSATGESVNLKKVQELVDEANDGVRYKSAEDIAEEYYKSKNIKKYKREYKGKKVKKFPRLWGGTAVNEILQTLHPKELKVQTAVENLLASDEPLAKLKNTNKNLSNLQFSKLSPWKQYISNETGLASKGIINSLNKPEFMNGWYQENKKLLNSFSNFKKDMEGFSFNEQLDYAKKVAGNKPIFTGMKGKAGRNSAVYITMNNALRSWNNTKGDGPVQFFDKNGKITWKPNIKLSYPNVYFTHGKNKYSVGGSTIGNRNTISIRAEGKNYFPEVWEQTNYRNQLYKVPVDDPFRKGKKIKFGELMTKIQNRGYKWKKTAGVLDLLHGPKGVSLEPFTNLSFGTKNLNLTLYHLDKIPIKGLKNKMINQVMGELKGLEGEKLMKAIQTQQIDLGKKIAAGEKFIIPTKSKLFMKALDPKTQILGPISKKEEAYMMSKLKESAASTKSKPQVRKEIGKFIEKALEKQKVPKGERGFIATALLEDFGKMGGKGLKLLKWLQLEYDVAFESLIYDYHRRYAGQEPGLAREALFLPKLIAKWIPEAKKIPLIGGLFEPYEAGIMEGPGEVLEKRLYEIKGTEKENLGKVIGEKKLVKSYIDNNKRMEEISSKWDNLDFQKKGSSRVQLTPEQVESFENQQAALAEEYQKLEKLNSPDSVSGFYDAYQTAKEKQDTEYGVKRIEAHKKRLGADEERLDELESSTALSGQEKRELSNLKRAQKRFEDEREKKRHEAYLEYKGGKERSFYLPKGKLKERVEDPLFKTPYTFLKTDDTKKDIWEPGLDFWDYYGLTDTQVGPVVKEGTKDKWKTIYDMGGIDLMDRIGIAGGVANMAEGGIMSLKKKW